MIVLPGERIVLRALRLDELDILSDAYLKADYPLGGAKLPTRAQLRRRIERSGTLWNGKLELGIEAEGRLVGDADARAPRGAFPPGVFEIGVTLFDAAERGRGYGLEATRLITDHLFATEGAERVQATTADWNTPMRRVLERLGFANEGTLRAFFPAENGRDDYVLYALTRSDWEGQ
jgi:[ribosomal protein S5]-alanine N-acetyltransferase